MTEFKVGDKVRVTEAYNWPGYREYVGRVGIIFDVNVGLYHVGFTDDSAAYRGWFYDPELKLEAR
jgi:ribosomal protein L21E